jgi:hypothetical protein
MAQPDLAPRYEQLPDLVPLNGSDQAEIRGILTAYTL